MELQQTVRQLQKTIDSQGVSLQRLVAVVDRLLASPPAPAAMSATTASSAASAPAASAAAGAPTAVGTVSAQAAVTAAGTVYEPSPWVKRSATCFDCGLTTYVCEHALYDENARIGCQRNKGWSKSKSSNWWCPGCWPTNETPAQWPVLCWQSHGMRDGAATPAPTSSPSEAALPAPPAPWGSPSAAPPPLAVVQPAAQLW